MLDWRRKAETVADVRVTIRDVLDELPDAPYPRPVYDAKVQAVFDHVYAAYGDEGGSPYDEAAVVEEPLRPALPAGAGEVTESVVAQLRSDAGFASMVARELLGTPPPSLRTIEELIANDEDEAVDHRPPGGTCAKNGATRPSRTRSSRRSPPS